MEDSLKVMIAEAIKVILSRLPDKDADRQAILNEALRGFPMYTQHRSVAEKKLTELIKCCPRCFGTFRQKKFWTIVRGYLDPAQAVWAYLRGFPSALTDRQKQSIAEYLTTLNFDQAVIAQGLSRFDRRVASGKSPRAHAGFVR